MSGAVADIMLTEADIPGASLQEPLEVHNVSALKWWLLCHGVQVSSSCKKPDYDRKVDPVTYLYM